MTYEKMEAETRLHNANAIIETLHTRLGTSITLGRSPKAIVLSTFCWETLKTVFNERSAFGAGFIDPTVATIWKLPVYIDTHTDIINAALIIMTGENIDGLWTRARSFDNEQQTVSNHNKPQPGPLGVVWQQEWVEKQRDELLGSLKVHNMKFISVEQWEATLKDIEALKRRANEQQVAINDIFDTITPQPEGKTLDEIIDAIVELSWDFYLEGWHNMDEKPKAEDWKRNERDIVSKLVDTFRGTQL